MNQLVAKSRCAVGLVVGVAALLILVLPAAPAGAVSREFFGVVPADSPGPEEFQTMGESNVGTYRFQLNWGSIQPSEGGAYDWSAADTRITNAALNGVQPLPFFYGSPSYAGTSREAPVGSAEAKEGWRRFLVAAAERYGPGGDLWDQFSTQNPGVKPRPIDVWQIWNEQNSPAFYEPKPSPKKYAELLRISDGALRSIDSGADILLGGMFGTPGRDRGIFSWKFLKRLYNVKGAKKHFDAVALHPYSPNLAGLEAQIELARKQVKKAGDAKTPTWITELGWGSAGNNGHDLVKSRGGQKKMLKKSFNLLLDKRGKWKIRRLLWFTWRDPDDPEDAAGVVCSWCASAGLFGRDLDPKPSFEQFRKFTGA